MLIREEMLAAQTRRGARGRARKRARDDPEAVGQPPAPRAKRPRPSRHADDDFLLEEESNEEEEEALEGEDDDDLYSVDGSEDEVKGLWFRVCV